MSAGNSEMLVFISVFSQQCAFFKFFNGRLGKKQKNVSFYGVCMYVRPKLTFVCFYFCFFAPSPFTVSKGFERPGMPTSDDYLHYM